MNYDLIRALRGVPPPQQGQSAIPAPDDPAMIELLRAHEAAQGRDRLAPPQQNDLPQRRRGHSPNFSDPPGFQPPPRPISPYM